MKFFNYSTFKNSSIESLNANAPQTAIKAGNESSAVLKEIFPSEFDRAEDASEAASKK